MLERAKGNLGSFYSWEQRQLGDVLSLLKDGTHGTHVETICVLGNKNRRPDDYLKVNIDVDKIHEILDREESERGAEE